jgi:hypothetical protein
VLIFTLILFQLLKSTLKGIFTFSPSSSPQKSRASSLRSTVINSDSVDLSDVNSSVTRDSSGESSDDGGHVNPGSENTAERVILTNEIESI